MAPAAGRVTRRLRVGGVPEHFNLPWHLAIESGAFERRGVEVVWHDQPGGTGQMVAALAEDRLDAVVALTEGVVRALGAGLAARVVSTYVTSALQWGVHVAAASGWADERELSEARFAVSRMGSGSHLMAFVLAERLGWRPDAVQIVVVGDLDGARAALADGRADVLLWDRFMTEPLVASGELRRIGVQPTPWPAFVLAAHDGVEPLALAAVATVIGLEAPAFPSRPDAVDLVTARYGLAPATAREWLAATTWGAPEPTDPAMLADVRATLRRLGLAD